MSDLGVAPDGIGLGEYLTEQAPPAMGADAAPAPSEPEPAPAPATMEQPAMPLPASPPMPNTQAGDSARAGLTLLAATAATGIGFALGGGWGALAGLLLAGSARNGFRASANWASADTTQKSEARKSAIVAMVGLGASGYSIYRAYTRE